MASGRAEIAGELGRMIRICAQCGSCASVCPFTNVYGFHIRRLARRLQLGLLDDELLRTYPWLCSQCASCHEFCPEGVRLPDVVLWLRKEALKRGLAPEAACSIIENVLKLGSPYPMPPERRGQWLGDRADLLSGRSEFVYWVGCTSSLRARNIAEATLNVLLASGVDFSVLDEALCCGEPLLRIGAVDEARELARKVSAAIEERKAEVLITSCAGCYATFKRDYPEELGIELPVEVLHISQALARWLSEGVIELPVEVRLRTAYHDPCSLRQLGLFDEPREALRAVPGVELVEPLFSRNKSRCCGGGGGVWAVNYRASMDVASRRLAEDILPLGVEAVVSACPMCYLTFRTTVRRQKMPVKVLDLAEVISMGLGSTGSSTE